MSRKRKRQPSKPGEPQFLKKPGPDQVLIDEGNHEQARHQRNIGEHPLTLAYERKQITPELYAAGNTYRMWFEKMNSSGKDSTQALNVAGGSGQSGWTQTQVDAALKLKAIEADMPSRSKRIVRYFCGEGRPMGEAVHRVTPCLPAAVKWRIIEALEDLEDALDKNRVRRAA